MALGVLHDRPEGPRFEQCRQRGIGINHRRAMRPGGQR